MSAQPGTTPVPIPEIGDAVAVQPLPGRANRVRIIGAVTALLGVVALYAAYKYVYYPRTPHYALECFLKAAQSREYERAYASVEMPRLAKALIPDARAFRRIADMAGGVIPELDSYRLGQLRTNGDAATIETTATGRMTPYSATTTIRFDARLVRVDDRWKVDGRWVLQELARRGGGAVLRAFIL